MERIKAIRDTLRSLPVLGKAFLIEAIQENTGYILFYNTLQLDQGIRGDAADIVPPYTPLTRQIKAIKGQPFDRVTLKDTGDFYAGLEIKINNDNFEIIGTDPKSTLLEQKYSVNIYGLTDENLEEFKNVILREALILKFRSHIL